MATASILDFQEKIVEDDSIKSYEYNAYYPTSGSNLNMPGRIAINIENQDEFYHPRRSWLLVEGDLLKANDTRYVNNDVIALVNNAIMFLFANLKYELGGQEIESLNHPGHATTLLGLAKHAYEYRQGAGLIQCWCADTSEGAANTNYGFNARKTFIIEKPNNKGSFQFAIPLEDMFGFCEDYDKIVYGMRHTLTLIRGGDDDAIFKANGVDAGKVKLSKISWMMPRVHPSDAKKFALYKNIESKIVIDVGFRMRQCNMIQIARGSTSMDWRLGVRTAPEKPRHILIGLQSQKTGQQTRNPAVFDEVNTTKMKIVMNDTEYPLRDINADFDNNHYAEFYSMFMNFSQNYYGIDPLINKSVITPIAYKDLFPLFYFDVSKQSERVNQSVVDVTVKMQFSAAVGNNEVFAYALVISDRRLKFQSDGKKMTVLY